MKRTIEINSNCYRSVQLWFVPYASTDAQVITSGVSAEHPMASFNHGFDYEKSADNKWKLHIDAGLSIMPVAEIKTRSSFDLECETGEEEHLFTTEGIPLLNDINRIVFKKCVKSFNEECTAGGLESGWNFEISDEHLQGFSEGMISQYIIRKAGDLKNMRLNKQALTLTQGKLTYLMVMATFLIIDDILHLNKVFDRKHNLGVFTKVISETYYYTLKIRCMRIETETIELILKDTILFAICLDCALQMLMNDHTDKLMPSIIANGLTTEKQQAFISFADGMLKHMRERWKSDGVHITNLEKRYDWNTLIK